MNKQMEYANNLQEQVTECMGAELVLDEVMRALSLDKRIEVLEYIANNWEVCADIEVEE